MTRALPAIGFCAVKCAILFLVLPCTGFAQLPFLSFGAKGGIPLTDSFQFGVAPGIIQPTTATTYAAETIRYTVGPTVEVKLPRHFSVEFDALYKRLNYGRTDVRPGPSSTTFRVSVQNVSDRWEFPLLLKYEIWTDHPAIYIEAGPTVNYFTNRGGHYQISGVVSGAPFNNTGSVKGTEFDPPLELVRTATGGVVFGGGLVLRLSHIRISPELRYTRWANPNFHEPDFARFLQAFLRSNQDQAEVLLGLSF